MEAWERRNLLRALFRTPRSAKTVHSDVPPTKICGRTGHSKVHHPRCLLTTTHTCPVTTCSGPLSNWVVLNFALRVCTGPGLDASPTRQPNNPHCNYSDSRFQRTMRLHVISLNCSAPSAIFDVNSSTRAVFPSMSASCRSVCRSSIHWQSSAGINPGITGMNPPPAAPDIRWRTRGRSCVALVPSNSATCSRKRLISASISDIEGTLGGGCIGA